MLFPLQSVSYIRFLWYVTALPVEKCNLSIGAEQERHRRISANDGDHPAPQMYYARVISPITPGKHSYWLSDSSRQPTHSGRANHRSCFYAGILVFPVTWCGKQVRVTLTIQYDICRAQTRKGTFYRQDIQHKEGEAAECCGSTWGSPFEMTCEK